MSTARVLAACAGAFAAGGGVAVGEQLVRAGWSRNARILRARRRDHRRVQRQHARAALEARRAASC